MVCPNCNSSDVKRVSLIHAAGMYELRGRISRPDLGIPCGECDGLLFGRYKGTSQSRLSKAVSPPTKLPYAAPAIPWLLGFFILMAFAGRGKLSWMIGIVSVGGVLLLPVYLFAALFYNFFVRPKKYRDWLEKFMCQHYGALNEALTVPQGRFASGPFRGASGQARMGRVSRDIMVRWRGRGK